MFILFDIGGTKMRFARAEDSENFGEPVKVPTPPLFEDALPEMERVIKELARGEKIDGMAGGIAGVFNRSGDILVKSPNLPKWKDVPLKEKLEHISGAPVEVRNDAAVVGLGEAVFGAGKEKSIVVYMTVSTGVGGTRIVDGKIDASAFGFEPGWQIIDMDKTACPDCRGIYLEDHISGRSLKERYNEEPYEVSDRKIWDDVNPKWLAAGLNNTIVHWSPDIVVLGGSMMVGNPSISLEKTKEYLNEYLKIFPEHPEIVKASLKDDGGLWGG
ncbi:ROK family protein, partial [bacterium]|nr:ROK family protein [bacterium]